LEERRDEGVVFLILHNPGRLNAIDMAMREDLATRLESLRKDAEARVVVLAGHGEHFCAGGDIKGWKDFTVVEARGRLDAIHRPLRGLLNLDKPVIAMVRGYAVGAGMNLALACDLVFAGETARFGQTFVRLGIIPDAGGLCLLPLAIGLHRAKELMWSAEIIEAREAHRLGIVNRVFPEDRLEEETLTFAQKLAKGPPLAIGLIKRILRLTFLEKLEAILEYEAQAQPLCFQTEDHKEGRRAFEEKRPPSFRGR